MKIKYIISVLTVLGLCILSGCEGSNIMTPTPDIVPSPDINYSPLPETSATPGLDTNSPMDEGQPGGNNNPNYNNIPTDDANTPDNSDNNRYFVVPSELATPIPDTDGVING